MIINRPSPIKRNPVTKLIATHWRNASLFGQSHEKVVLFGDLKHSGLMRGSRIRPASARISSARLRQRETLSVAGVSIETSALALRDWVADGLAPAGEYYDTGVNTYPHLPGAQGWPQGALGVIGKSRLRNPPFYAGL